LGIIRRKQGRWEEALETLSEAQRVFVRLEDKKREAEVVGNLGGIHASRGEREEAIKQWRRAGSLFEELGDQQRQGETFLALGLALFKSSERQAGLATYQIGLQLLERPTLIQRITRWLLTLQTRILGLGI